MRDSSKSNRPFLRWVGSKYRLLDEIIPYIPRRFNRYFEPFLGSAALFFHLRPEKAHLSDTNKDLIETFKAIRDNQHAVRRYLDGKKPNPTLYYQIRNNRSCGRLKRAAEFIYLNKTCWNALYRVNLRGEFNVPYGAPRTDFIFDPHVLKQCSAALNRPGISLEVSDFESACEKVRKNDFVFLDPPYVTTHNNNGFIEYNEDIFSWDDQVRLAKLSTELIKRGATVIVTNANHRPLIRLFEDFRAIEVSRRSTLAGDTTARRKVTEVILLPNGG